MTEGRGRHNKPTSRSSRKPDKRGQARAPTPADAGQEWVAVGLAVGAFGIRGDLKVQPLTDFPERFQQTSILYVGKAHTPHRLISARQHGRIVVVHLEGVEAANDAEQLRGAQLFIPVGELLTLPVDHYYVHDLIGLRVEHVDGTPLGVIRDVIPTGGNDLLVVRTMTGGADVLLPAVKEFIKGVDVPGGVVRVAPIPGLFDDNAIVAEQPGDAEVGDETAE
jgi:16S rRNA processing protein RimM